MSLIVIPGLSPHPATAQPAGPTRENRGEPQERAIAEWRVAFRRGERQKYDQAYFEREYWKEDLPGHVGNRGLSYTDPEHTNRFDFLASLFVRQFRFRTFLDAGCGTGLLGSCLRNLGKTGIDCDVSGVAAHAAHYKGNEVTVAGIEALPLRSDSVELVVCLDVLEHLPAFDVQDAVNELCRVSSGLVVSTINLDNPYRFHPTILSRDTWNGMFMATGLVRHRRNLEERLQCSLNDKYQEYEAFVFERQ